MILKDSSCNLIKAIYFKLIFIILMHANVDKENINDGKVEERSYIQCY